MTCRLTSIVNILRGGYAAPMRAGSAPWVFRARRGSDLRDFFGLGGGGDGAACSTLAGCGCQAGRGGREAAPPSFSVTYGMAAGIVGMSVSERMGQGIAIAHLSGRVHKISQLPGARDRAAAQLGRRLAADGETGGAFPPSARARVTYPRPVRQDWDLENLRPSLTLNADRNDPLGFATKPKRDQKGSGVQGRALPRGSVAKSADFRGLKQGQGKGRDHRSIDAGRSRTMRAGLVAVNGAAS